MMASSSPTLLIFSRHLMQDRFAGNSAHVRSLIDYLRANGVRVVLLITSLRGLGRKPFARVPLDRSGFDAILLAGGFRLGPWLVRFAPSVWVRAARLAAARASRRRAGGDGGDRFWDIGPIDAGERRAIRKAGRRVRPDAAFANYFYLAEGLDVAQFASTPKLAMVHDIFSARNESFHATGLPLPHAPITRKRELADLSHADTLLSVQQTEAELLRSLLPDKQVLLMPISFPLRPTNAEPEPDTIMFVGGDNEVNVAGLDWLLHEVWPRLLRLRSSARLSIYGRVAGRVAVAPDNVALVGRMDNLTPAYHRNAACVVPLRAGSGQKVKLVEAMCHGRAIVSTSVGAQGFERLAGTCFLLADEADLFASACARLLAEATLRKQLQEAALEEARVRFSEDACYGPVLRCLRT